ncbi:MAG TPA: hypothetical protein VK473_10600 [Terriglobales bacterium]|nr:hypothetical protein [Terriglobales bacterium]
MRGYLSRAYGLLIASNLPIPGLACLPDTGAEADICARLGEIPVAFTNPHLTSLPCYIANSEEPDSLRLFALDSGHFHLRYGDGVEFVLDRTGSEIWACWGPESSLEDTATYLLGPVFGFLLRLRGITCLHAAAVAIDGRVAAFLGPAGAGKSTLAAAMARLGHAVACEDVLPITETAGEYLVHPGYPRVRLWPDSAAALFGSADALPRLSPNWQKQYLDLEASPFRFLPQPLPLGAVYVLNESPEARPRIVDIPPREALMALAGNTYASIPLDPSTRAAEFQTLTDLVRRLPVRQLLLPGNFATLLSACHLVSENFHTPQPVLQHFNV